MVLLVTFLAYVYHQTMNCFFLTSSGIRIHIVISKIYCMSDIHWFWAKNVINFSYIMLEVWLIDVWSGYKHFYDWSEIYQQVQDELQRIELSAVWCDCRNPKNSWCWPAIGKNKNKITLYQKRNIMQTNN